MHRAILTMLGALSLLAIGAGLATASVITVERLERAEGLNIEMQGVTTFEAAGIRVICNKTMIGELRERTEGTLGLAGNNAGKIGRVLFGNCNGGVLAAGLVTLEDPMRLSWVRVEPRRLELAALPYRVEVTAREPFGANVTCLYLALMLISANAEGINTRFELRLGRILTDGIRKISREGIACPTERVLVIGTLRFVNPATEFRVSLA